MRHLLAALFACWLVKEAYAIPINLQQMTSPVYEQTGNNASTFNVLCSTTAWTVVLASSTIARETIYQAAPGNIDSICLEVKTSSEVVNNSACSDTSQGVELSSAPATTASVMPDELIDFSEISYYCRGRALTSVGTTPMNIKGIRYYDSNDQMLNGYSTW
jgi:hypothetical protein